MPLIDTTTTQGLLSMFISDLVLQILSFVAETEREHIKRRQREGIAAAMARGIKFGRPKRQLPRELQATAVDFRNGALILTKAAAQCHMPPTTF